MTPDEEDALVESCFDSLTAASNSAMEDVIRLTIRAAVAHERERCAKWCDSFAEELRPYAEREYSRDDAIARDCAAAIRSGK